MINSSFAVFNKIQGNYLATFYAYNNYSYEFLRDILSSRWLIKFREFWYSTRYQEISQIELDRAITRLWTLCGSCERPFACGRPVNFGRKTHDARSGVLTRKLWDFDIGAIDGCFIFEVALSRSAFTKLRLIDDLPSIITQSTSRFPTCHYLDNWFPLSLTTCLWVRVIDFAKRIIASWTYAFRIIHFR